MATPCDTVRLAVSCSLLLLVAACGEDSTQPTPAPADVSGLYEVLATTSPASCDPPEAFEVLQATLGDGALRLTLRVEQLDGEVRISPVSGQGPYGPVTFENATPRVVPMDDDGSIQIESDGTNQVTLGDRAFFIRVTGASTGRFDREARPVSLSISATFTQVFREGSASAAVFASCTQTQTMTGSRAGD